MALLCKTYLAGLILALLPGPRESSALLPALRDGSAPGHRNFVAQQLTASAGAYGCDHRGSGSISVDGVVSDYEDDSSSKRPSLPIRDHPSGALTWMRSLQSAAANRPEIRLTRPLFRSLCRALC